MPDKEYGGGSRNSGYGSGGNTGGKKGGGGGVEAGVGGKKKAGVTGSVNTPGVDASVGGGIGGTERTGVEGGVSSNPAQDDGRYSSSRMPPNADVPVYENPSLGQIISSLGRAPTGPFGAVSMGSAIAGQTDGYGRSFVGAGIDGLTGQQPGRHVGGTDVDRDTNPGRYGAQGGNNQAGEQDGVISSDKNALPASPLAQVMETLLEYTSKGGDPAKRSVPIQQQTAIPLPFNGQSSGVVA